MPYQIPGDLAHLLGDDNALNRLLLEKHYMLKIHTATDLFAADFNALNVLAHKANIDLKNLIQLRKALSDRLLGKSFTTLTPTSIEYSLNTPIRCGSARLNDVLVQIPYLNTIDICGPSGSGKSQLVYSMALESAVTGKEVFFVDCDNSFRKELLFDLLSNKYSLLTDYERHQVLSRIRVAHIFKFDKLIDYLNLIGSHIKNGLIIIDSISYILHTQICVHRTKRDMRRKHQKRLSAIFIQLREALKWLTAQTDSAAVLTRLSARELDLEWDILLEADLSLELKDEDDKGQVKVDLINRTSTQLASPSEFFTFEITDSGIK